jgi:hypothetical protein
MGPEPRRNPGEPMKKMKRKEYETEMRLLHGELVAMQEWVRLPRLATRCTGTPPTRS